MIEHSFAIGIDIQEMEKEGIILPVVEMKMETRLMLRYRIVNQHKKLVCKAHTSLVMADKLTGKLISDSSWLQEKLEIANI